MQVVDGTASMLDDIFPTLKSSAENYEYQYESCSNSHGSGSSSMEFCVNDEDRRRVNHLRSQLKNCEMR